MNISKEDLERFTLEGRVLKAEFEKRIAAMVGRCPMCGPQNFCPIMDQKALDAAVADTQSTKETDRG